MKTQQEFGERNTCIPLDTSHVQGRMTSILSRDENLGESSLKTPLNNPEVNHSLHTGSSDLRVQDIVYVLNKRGKPLMPTRQQKSLKLLKSNKAKVIRRNPFTIQLLQASGETKQDITLDIDSGFSWVGFSATTTKKELISGELELRKNISKLLEQRKMYRRNRRSRLWYRHCKFPKAMKGKQIVSSKPKGWLAPSLQHKLDAHLRLVSLLQSLFPVTKTIVEVASFDTQKMQNPEISNIEYQQGELCGYEVREYLLEKWGRKCAYCKKKDVPLEIEHIIPKSRGGSSRVSNLTLACRGCNQKKNQKTAAEFGYPNIQKQAKKPLKSAAFMNVVRKKLVDILDCDYTYGYITKYNRIKLGLEKSHANDAFAISGTTQKRCKQQNIKQVRRNNRSLQTNRKGFKPSIRRKRYQYHPMDLVRYKNQACRVKGVFNYGKWIRLIDSSANIININIKNVELITYGQGLCFV